ncbi:hypothetical protein [Staphylococcus argenteus]|uniref:hypothetical protein n=1 Tax=Staphylococcus TaxID=1279 RepID=UPI000E337542|nr:hypothetical protein [Staphylococcus argenteus]BBD87507.1 hypothetical protein SA58113_p20063 [Staphylococcus argenteus]
MDLANNLLSEYPFIFVILSIVFVFVIIIFVFIPAIKKIQQDNINRIQKKLENKEHIEGIVTKKQAIQKDFSITKWKWEYNYLIEIDNSKQLYAKTLKQYNAIPLNKPCKVVAFDETIMYLDGYTKIEGRGMLQFLKE